MATNEWKEIVGTPCAPEDAWRILDQWRVKQNEIGCLYCVRSSTAVLAGLYRVVSVRNGVVQLKGEGAGASLNLKQANFTHGPMDVWPHWPYPPAAQVLALQVYLPGGDWVVLTEGYLPKELATLALPA